MIATFGVARPSPTYAADATVALDEALGEIDRWNAHRHAAGLDPVAVNAALTIGQAMRLDALARFEDADFPQMRVLGRDAEMTPR